LSPQVGQNFAGRLHKKAPWNAPPYYQRFAGATT
jgi:hypothetical protein